MGEHEAPPLPFTATVNGLYWDNELEVTSIIAEGTAEILGDVRTLSIRYHISGLTEMNLGDLIRVTVEL